MKQYETHKGYKYVHQNNLIDWTDKGVFINKLINSPFYTGLYAKRIGLVNCWEFLKCGREKGGLYEYELGVCPAWPDNGKNCAEIPGTLCDRKVAGSFALKIADCTRCEFFISGHYEGRSTAHSQLVQTAKTLNGVGKVYG